MSAVENPYPVVTVTLGWREPNGQVIEFGGGADSADSSATPPAAASASGSSSASDSSDQGSQDGEPGGGANVNLFA